MMNFLKIFLFFLRLLNNEMCRVELKIFLLRDLIRTTSYKPSYCRRSTGATQ